VRFLGRASGLSVFRHFNYVTRENAIILPVRRVSQRGCSAQALRNAVLYTRQYSTISDIGSVVAPPGKSDHIDLAQESRAAPSL
jgi:hypothetical protein